MNPARPIRFVRTFARDRWWRHFPFMPLPPWTYVKFRQVTMYGESGVRVLPRMLRDLPQYYRWWCSYDRYLRRGAPFFTTRAWRAGE